MAQKTIQLPSISQGWYMSWTISTQAANNICVTLADNTATYVNNVCKQSTNFLPPLATGYQQVQGSNLYITINIPQSSTIKTSLQPYTVQTPDGITVGQGYNLILEDSDDNDYNDLFASIMSWKNNG